MQLESYSVCLLLAEASINKQTKLYFLMPTWAKILSLLTTKIKTKKSLLIFPQMGIYKRTVLFYLPLCL